MDTEKEIEKRKKKKFRLFKKKEKVNPEQITLDNVDVLDVYEEKKFMKKEKKKW